MKIILAEEQARTLVMAEQSYAVLSESVSFDFLKRKVAHLVAIGMATSAIILSINRLNIPDTEKQILSDIVYENTDTQQMNDSIFKEKVNAATKYMEYALKNQGFSFENTDLTPEALVKASMQTGFDLPFLMAAAHCESCFGATKRAKKTNSVFSVGAYDNGNDVVSYPNADSSVLPYIELLNNHYLVNGKTIKDLLVPGQFVNDDGHRYASNTNYENAISSVRNRIIRMYPVLANS